MQIPNERYGMCLYRPSLNRSINHFQDAVALYEKAAAQFKIAKKCKLSVYVLSMY